MKILIFAITIFFSACVTNQKSDSRSVPEGHHELIPYDRYEGAFIRTPLDHQALDRLNEKPGEDLLSPLAIAIKPIGFFDENTLYHFENAQIERKLSGGYIIGFPPKRFKGSSRVYEFRPAFLKIQETLPEDKLISGVAIYSGTYELKSSDGSSEILPQLIIPGDQPVVFDEKAQVFLSFQRKGTIESSQLFGADPTREAEIVFKTIGPYFLLSGGAKSGPFGLLKDKQKAISSGARSLTIDERDGSPEVADFAAKFNLRMRLLVDESKNKQ